MIIEGTTHTDGTWNPSYTTLTIDPITDLSCGANINMVLFNFKALLDQDSFPDETITVSTVTPGTEDTNNWNKTIGGSYDDYAYILTTDSERNVYVSSINEFCHEDTDPQHCSVYIWNNNTYQGSKYFCPNGTSGSSCYSCAFYEDCTYICDEPNNYYYYQMMISTL